MARNEEKLFGRLNRLYLQKQLDGELQKNPPRPKLASLNSADAIRRWLPTISRDIEQNLMQLEVTCHPERVLGDIRRRISYLESEHRAFTLKLREYDQAVKHIATDNACYRKRPHHGHQRGRDIGADNGNIASKICRDAVSAESSACVQLTSTSSPSCLSVPIPDSHVKRFSDPMLVSKIERLSLPILDSQLEQQYAEEACPLTRPIVWNCDLNACNAPLDVKPHLPRSNSRGDDPELAEVTACHDQVEVVETLSNSCFSALANAYGDIDD